MVLFVLKKYFIKNIKYYLNFAFLKKADINNYIFAKNFKNYFFIKLYYY